MKPGRYRVLFTKKTNLINIVMCWCLAFVGSAPLFFTFESGRFQFPSLEAMCLITFEDDTAFIIFSNVFYIATPFAIIKVYCVKVFRAVSRSIRVFSHKNNPRRYRANVEEAKVTLLSSSHVQNHVMSNRISLLCNV